MKEIVIVMGYNASGKTTLVEEFVEDGFFRINRDLIGGTLDQQADLAIGAMQNGHDKIVLDNTYANIKSRESIIKAAQQFGVPIRCVWLATSFEDAQLNACMRMLERTGKILMPEDFKGKYKNDPNLFPPVALFSYKKRFEKPTVTEGFSDVEKRPFVRKWDSKYKNKAILLDYDDTLRVCTGPKKWPEDPSEVDILPGRKEKLTELVSQGYKLLGVSNQSAIAKGLPEKTARACFDRTNDLLGHQIEYKFCPHGSFPVACYCRKPQPGIGAWYIFKYQLNPAECIMVGDQTSDKTFAKRCGFQYKDEKEFFSD